MDKPTVILVGGFLGAGKTTLLATVAERLVSQGKRVGLITNDQAANLVDTASFNDHDLPVEEVSGGCFCCRFDDLIGAMDRLISQEQPDVLLGEPVGSCTDLSATVMQPLKALHRERYRLAPSSVLVDPDRVRPLLGLTSGRIPAQVFPENVVYIYRKQLEEADIIVLNKIDLISSEERLQIEGALRRVFPGSQVMSLSAKEGTGVDGWLQAVMGQHEPERTVTDVDYDVYADGEAALGWLNAAYELDADAGADWEDFCRKLMAALCQEFRELPSEVAHLKIHMKAGSGTLAANLTTSGGEPTVRGGISGSHGKARLLLNVRAHIDPAGLSELVDRVVAGVASPAARAMAEKVECFAPARPQPTHRYRLVV
jgi:Ni2+-binding GTPase involved in maturation of urease and hydrogenase